ncbi:hypothetical protein [Methylobacterium nonmethylotrophicum]|uniref:hypothetical protein n=1 Tax=Methylobacterium nonmethylotrophicum TaxID=1141884 RepID=UPI001436ADBA|nr:hypothetical protein [Methylobacterium nonmethylotrophicum]
MFVEGGWRSPWEPPPRQPRLTQRQERMLVWIIVVNVLLWFMAPIGGATLIQAALAMMR